MPWIYHGTSASYEESIRSSGLTFASRPYDNAEIDAVVRLLAGKKMYGDDAGLGVLAAFTSSTGRAGTISLTFDWLLACRYAALNRGGETIEYLLRSVEYALDPIRADAFSSGERRFLASVLVKVTPISRLHEPLVVAVEMPRDWYLANGLVGRSRPPEWHTDLFGGKAVLTGTYTGGAIRRGEEFREVALVADQIRAYVRFSADEELRNLIARL